MTVPFRQGPLTVRLARSGTDVAECQRLRQTCFRGGAGLDSDPFDDLCDHLMIMTGDRLVATLRYVVLPNGAALGHGYTAARYGLGALAGVTAPLVEMGRFCVAPGLMDADVLRLAMGALARVVDRTGAAMMVGCSSFAGTDPAAHADAFGYLADYHAAPAHLAPTVRSPETVPLATAFDPRRARAQLPPLLRSYLGIGGWVSDHAVIDRDLGTLHVFTGVEIARVPAARARALRAIAAQEGFGL